MWCFSASIKQYIEQQKHVWKTDSVLRSGTSAVGRRRGWAGPFCPLRGGPATLQCRSGGGAAENVADERVERVAEGPGSLPETRERSRAFAECARGFGFTDYDLQSYGARCKNRCWIGEHLDAHVAQSTATRAFRAAERYLFRSSGKPRFKTKRQGLSSLEGKSNATGIRWRIDRVEWSGLILAPRFDRKDSHGVQSLALQCPVKYVRLVRRSVRGRIRWFVRIVCSGTPKWKEKNPVGEGTVGLDLGPTTVAVVGDGSASLEGFCPGLPDFEKKAGRLKGAMDRSRRLSNPGHFNPDGTVKRGSREWVFTRGHLRLRGKVSDLERRKAAYRKTGGGRKSQKRRVARSVLPPSASSRSRSCSSRKSGRGEGRVGML